MILSLIFSLSSFALDQKLADYMREFEMTPMESPAPVRAALYELGQNLFFDPALSGKGNINCAMCHMPGRGTSDGLPLSLGEGFSGGGMNRRQNSAAILLRNSPSLYNLGVSGIPHLYWDGRVSKDEQGWVTPEAGLNGADPEYKEIAQTLDSLLAVQALFPIADPDEMLGRGSPLNRLSAWEAALERILNGARGAEYKLLFEKAYGQIPLNIAHIANALGEFQTHAFHSDQSPWDNYLKGDLSAMNLEMKKGAILFFEKAQCANCHAGMHLSLMDFDSVGTPHLGVAGRDDVGRMNVTGDPEDKYMYRVSPLRNIALTAPYMHNGVFATMWEVIDFYNRPEEILMTMLWSRTLTHYNEPLMIDQDPQRQAERLAAIAGDLPRSPGLTQTEQEELWCFMVKGLTDMRLMPRIQRLLEQNPRCLAN